MNKIVKRMTIFLLCFILVGSTGAETFALTAQARGAFLMDGDTGEVLFEQNADQPLVPGSMAKLMTAYILLDQVKLGNITLDTKVPISRQVSALSKSVIHSNVPLEINQRYTMDALLHSIIVVSACGASKAVAEYFSGSEEAFAQLMNQYAKYLGLNAYFADSSGISPCNCITARSMAVLSRRLVTDFPVILEYAKQPSITFAGKTYESTDTMLEGMPQYYLGVDGLKTGFINKAKYCFAGTAKRADVRLISVVMGAGNKYARFDETRKLFDYGFEKKNIQDPWKHAWANPDQTQVVVNGKMVPMEVYTIEGSHYVKLRDVASALDATPKSFNVEWSAPLNAILLHTQVPYEPVGGELAGVGYGRDSMAINSKIYLDGTQIRLKGYDIGGTCFFNLREIATAMGIDVLWNGTDYTIRMDTIGGIKK